MQNSFSDFKYAPYAFAPIVAAARVAPVFRTSDKVVNYGKPKGRTMTKTQDDYAYAIGDAPFSREEMIAALDEFAALYEKRPIKDNHGGMLSPHMFPLWFATRRLKPKAVVESGVFKGQSTWLIEQAAPEAKIYCIDPELDRVEYRSERALYFSEDFSRHDWTDLPAEDTLLFFDDHQNAYDRLKAAAWFGFKKIIFEDNYPLGQGNCYSIKHALSKADPQFAELAKTFKPEHNVAWWKRLLGLDRHVPSYEPTVEPETDAKYLRRNLAVYYEFPPVVKLDRNRWGDPWNESYPTPAPLLEGTPDGARKIYEEEAASYTWMAYIELR